MFELSDDECECGVVEVVVCVFVLIGEMEY